MASAESSASMAAANAEASIAVAPVQTKKPRKQAAPSKKTATGKRVTAPKPKAKAGGKTWLERTQEKQLASREVKESGAFKALKDKKPHLIRGVSLSPFNKGDEKKFVVWIEGSGEEGEYEIKDGLALGKKVCKDNESLLENLAALDPFKPNYPQNTIQLLDSSKYPDPSDVTVAWRTATKIKIVAVQAGESEEDEEMTEEAE